MYNILVVDDDKEIVESIEIFLKNEGYNVYKAYNGMEALDVLVNNDVHLILMDIMMPKLDGIKATIKIREEKNIPIILVSAKSEDTDKIMGLNIGADDYITKPFNLLELIARVKSNLRRYVTLGTYNNEKLGNNEVLISGGLELNTSTKEVKVDGQIVRVTPIEFKILNLLIANSLIVLFVHITQNTVLPEYPCRWRGGSHRIFSHWQVMRPALTDPWERN